MDEIFTKAVSQLVSGVACAVASYCYAMYRAKKKEDEAVRVGVQALLRDRLIQAYYYHMEKGWIPLDSWGSLAACYESYEALGENGVIDDIMEQLRKLPHRKPTGGAL